MTTTPSNPPQTPEVFPEFVPEPDKKLTQARLKEVLWYDEATGHFWWRERGPGRRFNCPAGCARDRKYIVIYVDGRLYRAHQLAWLYVSGEWPTNTIDHEDTNGLNNRWGNLRDVTQAVNSQNQRRAHVNSKTGILGVDFREGKAKPWRALIYVSGRSKTVGHFATAEEASAAYVAAKRESHEGCTL